MSVTNKKDKHNELFNVAIRLLSSVLMPTVSNRSQ